MNNIVSGLTKFEILFNSRISRYSKPNNSIHKQYNQKQYKGVALQSTHNQVLANSKSLKMTRNNSHS